MFSNMGSSFLVARGLKPDAHISVSRPGSGRRRASGSSRPPSPPCVAVMVARVPADASVIPRDPNARRDPNPNALGITLKRDLTRKDTIGSQKIVEDGVSASEQHRRAAADPHVRVG